jgi:hypothetical protein
MAVPAVLKKVFVETGLAGSARNTMPCGPKRQTPQLREMCQHLGGDFEADAPERFVLPSNRFRRRLVSCISPVQPRTSAAFCTNRSVKSREGRSGVRPTPGVRGREKEISPVQKMRLFRGCISSVEFAFKTL